MRTLILHVTHQFNDNTKTFVKRGLIDDEEKDFIFIFNGIPRPEDYDFIHQHNNMRLFIRPNVGHDFQGWNEALFLPACCLAEKIIYSDKLPQDDTYMYQLYDAFVCVNSTVTGPYLPLYVEQDWVSCFTSKLSQDVKMVGIGINGMFNQGSPQLTNMIYKEYRIVTTDFTHIQSMIYAIDREGMELLVRHGLFANHKQFPKDKAELIITSEIGMGVIMRHHGKALYSFIHNQGKVPTHVQLHSANVWQTNTYPMFETIFAKTNIPAPLPQEIIRYNS